MIPIEAIRNVKRIIVHEQRRGVPCPDGLSATLCFYSLRNLLKMTPALLLDFAGKIGPTLVETRMSAAREAARNAVVYTLDGVRFATIPSCELTSDVSDIMAESVDMVVGFEYVHESDGGGGVAATVTPFERPRQCD